MEINRHCRLDPLYVFSFRYLQVLPVLESDTSRLIYSTVKVLFLFREALHLLFITSEISCSYLMSEKCLHVTFEASEVTILA